MITATLLRATMPTCWLGCSSGKEVPYGYLDTLRREFNEQFWPQALIATAMALQKPLGCVLPYF